MQYLRFWLNALIISRDSGQHLTMQRNFPEIMSLGSYSKFQRARLIRKNQPNNIII